MIKQLYSYFNQRKMNAAFKSTMSRLITQSIRDFGVLPKLPKLELTMRTPYRTIFSHFSNYEMVYVETTEGWIGLGGKSNARVYILPPGEIRVRGLAPESTKA